MACSFAALARSECPPASAAPAAAAAAAAFEWSPAGRAAAPLFASLSAAPAGARRAAGAPLFALARAAAAPGVEDLRRVTVTGDGRCLFRAIALGLARNQGRILRADAETLEADQLRLAVADVLCRGHKPRQAYGAAVLALEAEDTLKNYCKKIMAPTFWGGEPEMLALSKMLQVPVFVYIAVEGRGGGYTPIQKYGEEYRSRRRPVRLLFCNGNHFDALYKK